MLDLNAYKSQLQSLRSELTQRLDAITRDLHHEDEKIEKDFAEQATQQENSEVLMSLDDETRTKVMQIDKALLRIKDGSFGKCTSCGTEINEERLKVVPFASLCITCAENES